MTSRFQVQQEKRARRQTWVNKVLKQAEATHLDVAQHIGVNPRTWREWIALGTLPNERESLILEALGVEKGALSEHFSWR